MYKLDPILKDFSLEVPKTSEKYIEMKAMMEKFEKKDQLQQKMISSFFRF